MVVDRLIALVLVVAAIVMLSIWLIGTKMLIAWAVVFVAVVTLWGWVAS